MSARVWVPGRSVSGPAQRSAQTPRWETARKSSERAGTEPRPYRSSAGPMYLRHGPYGTKEKPHRPPWPAAQSGASASRMQGMGGNAAKIIPPRSINLGQSLSRGLWPRQLPLHKGALPCGGTGGHTGPPLRGHRSAQQPQVGRDRARPLQEDWSRSVAAGCGHPALRKLCWQCAAAGRCRHRPLRKNGGYGAASPLEIAAVRPRRAAKRLRPSREKSRKGPKAPSWFPPPAEKSRIIFPGGMYGGKNSSHEATCGGGPAPMGRGLLCAKAQCTTPSGIAGWGIGHRAAQGRHGAGGL